MVPFVTLGIASLSAPCLLLQTFCPLEGSGHRFTQEPLSVTAVRLVMVQFSSTLLSPVSLTFAFLSSENSNYCLFIPSRRFLNSSLPPTQHQSSTPSHQNLFSLSVILSQINSYFYHRKNVLSLIHVLL